MTGLFDGMAELLADALGSSVLHRPTAGGSVAITSVFRLEPTEILRADGGAVLGSTPTWRVPQSRAAGISIDDEIEPGDGATYRVVNRLTSYSPADDRFVIYELERVL